MGRSKTHKSVTVRTAEHLGRALGLCAADTAEMEFRSEFTVALAKIIQAGRLTHVEIAKGRGTSRTQVDRDRQWETSTASRPMFPSWSLPPRALAQEVIMREGHSPDEVILSA